MQTQSELLESIAQIAHELHTQDNSSTSHPFYIVQERHNLKSGDVRWDNVRFYFTRQSAEAYIIGGAHNHRGVLRIWVASAHDNWEIRVIRQWIMESFPKGQCRHDHHQNHRSIPDLT